MVKKLLIAGTVAATVLMLAGGAAFARDRHHRDSGNTNVGIVYGNNVVAVANTGLNGQVGGGDQDIDTGNAIATAGQDILVNASTCGCDRRGRRGEGSTTNFGLVAGNNVVAVANSGLNFQRGGVPVNNLSTHHHRDQRQESEQEIETGKADAYAWQTIVVNSSLGEEVED